MNMLAYKICRIVEDRIGRLNQTRKKEINKDIAGLSKPTYELLNSIIK